MTQTATPTVGLALIALDEADELPHLLRSIEGAFDQVVLLDTGSTDETVSVFTRWAREQDLALGYKVEAFEWVDDFAAARNAADAMLDTDWECAADCDDVIEGAHQLREILGGAPGDVGMLKAVYLNDPAHPESVDLRPIFRRGVGIWTCPIHEFKWPRIAARLEAPRIDPAQVRWVHRRDQKRNESNARARRIAIAWARQEPTNPMAAYQAQRADYARGHLGPIAWLRMAHLSSGPAGAQRSSGRDPVPDTSAERVS